MDKVLVISLICSTAAALLSPLAALLALVPLFLEFIKLRQDNYFFAEEARRGIIKLLVGILTSFLLATISWAAGLIVAIWPHSHYEYLLLLVSIVTVALSILTLLVIAISIANWAIQSVKRL